MASPLSAAGLGAFVWICLVAFISARPSGPEETLPETKDAVHSVRFLAVGDINLGRLVGQEILGGDTLFPFAAIRDDFAKYDFVFGNLECQLSDQKGETQHPGNNLIFTGPPEGAVTLRRGGITHVSTANNHALDYGVGALVETMDNLNRAGVTFSGTAGPGGDPFAPALFTVNGVSFALFSCTDVMNMEDRFWTRYVAEADSSRLFPLIRDLRSTVDIILVSYHGGAEYSERPSAATRGFALGALNAGADLFLGHHPHVPQGIEEVDGKLIAYSLGNFVFYQSFSFWTQRSFALEVNIRKDREEVRVESFRCLPVLASHQPFFLGEMTERHIVHDRIDRLSASLQTPGYPWPN